MFKRLMATLCLALSINCVAQTASHVGTNVQPVVSASGVSVGSTLSGPNSVSYVVQKPPHLDQDDNAMIAEWAVGFCAAGLACWLILSKTEGA